MQECSNPVSLHFPFGNRFKFGSKMRFPESNMTHSSYTENSNQFCTLLNQGINFFRVSWQVCPGGKISLFFGDSKFPKGIIECLFHGILKCSRIIGFKCIAHSVAPLVHIKSVNMFSTYVPFLKKIDRPFV